jgi:thiol-disulfide isomerase/thioredoxin
MWRSLGGDQLSSSCLTLAGEGRGCPSLPGEHGTPRPSGTPRVSSHTRSPSWEGRKPLNALHLTLWGETLLREAGKILFPPLTASDLSSSMERTVSLRVGRGGAEWCTYCLKFPFLQNHPLLSPLEIEQAFVGGFSVLLFYGNVEDWFLT